MSNIFIKYNFLTSDTFCNLISMPCFSRPRFFRVQFFQSLGFQGAGFSGLRFFKVQVFLATGVCRVYIFQGICFPGSRVWVFLGPYFSEFRFFWVLVQKKSCFLCTFLVTGSFIGTSMFSIRLDVLTLDLNFRLKLFASLKFYDLNFIFSFCFPLIHIDNICDTNQRR